MSNNLKNIISFYKSYYKDLDMSKINSVVLGCTHFPLAKDAITKILGPVTFVHGGPGIANRIKNLLIEQNLPVNEEDFNLNIISNDSNTKSKIKKILETEF